MIIGVDAGCLAVNDARLKAGVYYVVYHLLTELAKIDTKNTYYLYSFRPIDKELIKQFPKHTENIVLPSFGWLYLSLPLSFLFKKPEVFLATSQAMPIYHPCKTIGFIHGLDFFPEFHPKSNSTLKRNSEYLIRNADMLVATSEFLKKSLQEKYNTPSIVVSPLGVDEIFSQKTAAYKIDTPYFLFVGTLKSSKNIPTLIKAFSLFLKHIKKPYTLLLIGSNFWLDTNIQQQIKKEHLEDNVSIIPSTPNTELPLYYRGAVALVSPSLYEGFGLPMLEAMASGCPVISSHVGAIPEVVGENGILVNPRNIDEIKKAMIQMTKTDVRNQYIQKGKRRAKQFTWEKFTKSIYTIIMSYEK